MTQYNFPILPTVVSSRTKQNFKSSLFLGNKRYSINSVIDKNMFNIPHSTDSLYLEAITSSTGTI